MNKTVRCLLLSFSLALMLAAGAAGQAKMSLEKSPAKKNSGAEADPASKIVKPRNQTEQENPVVLVLPRADRSGPSAKAPKPTNQAAAQSQAPLNPECSWSLLLLNEVGSYYITHYNMGCLGCRIGTDLSQSTPGILGFSLSPSGPWSETLTVYSQLDFSGNGTSEVFYIKGLTSGASTFHGQNLWSSFDVDFQVVPCACPEIPIVP
jgi:hypothetical protein